MLKSNLSRRRIAAAIATGCAGLALAGTASALDLRDWGRTFPASQRFVVLTQFKNEAVLDKETQLVWQREPASTPFNYGGADNSYCSGKAIGGRYGWRLPSRFELLSLLDPSVPAPIKLPVGHPFVGVVDNGAYWTSSPAANPDPAYVNYRVVVGIGAAVQFLVSANGGQQELVWCVRGPG